MFVSGEPCGAWLRSASSGSFRLRRRIRSDCAQDDRGAPSSIGNGDEHTKLAHNRLARYAATSPIFPKGLFFGGLPMHRRVIALVFVLSVSFVLSARSFAQQPPQPIKDFIRVQSPVIALEHVQLIDGTGAAAKADQTIVISGGKITAIGNAGSVQIPAEAQHIDYTGYSALPGLVGMHDHLFYPAGGGLYHNMPFSFPRLYLALGVTTIRTTGSIEPYFDLEIKKAVDAGKIPGPKINATGPYMEGEGIPLLQLHQLTGPDDASRTVEYWV